MAIREEEFLKKSLQKKELFPVYILFGDDGYLKKNYADKIGALIAEPDDIFNYCRFEHTASLQSVYDAVLQVPFMGDKKFIELCDFDFVDCGENEFNMLCELVTSVPDTAVFVLRFDFFETDFKKNKRFLKLVSAAEGNGGVCVSLNHRKGADLVKMLMEGAARRGCRMDRSVAEYLLEVSGEDIFILKNEIVKLCDYSKGQPITKATVDLVAVKTVEARVFDLSKFILASNTAAAINCLDELLYMRIPAMNILYAVAASYIDMFRIFAAKGANLRIPAVAEEFGYGNRTFALENAERNLRRFDFNRLSLSLAALTETDNALKSFGANERTVLEELIIKLIYIITEGEAIDKA